MNSMTPTQLPYVNIFAANQISWLQTMFIPMLKIIDVIGDNKSTSNGKSPAGALAMWSVMTIMQADIIHHIRKFGITNSVNTTKLVNKPIIQKPNVNIIPVARPQRIAKKFFI